MPEPIRLDPARVLEFIESPRPTVVLVSVHPRHTFSPALCRHLRDDLGDEVAFGSVDLVALMLQGGPVVALLHDGLHACGAPAAYGILPGYWLFRGGQLLAWASGLPARDDATAIARSAVLGALWTGVTRNASFLAQALRMAAEQVGARRVAWIFRQAAAAPNTRRHWRADRAAPAEDELGHAYQTLGVPPTASDEEVQQAWRARRFEAHPDHAAGDPAEFERRSRLAAELNHARDVVFGHRARGRRAGAA